jgi:hypothetical protein
MSELERLRSENEELRYQVGALREAVDTNNREALLWKARLVEKIERLEAALADAERV